MTPGETGTDRPERRGKLGLTTGRVVILSALAGLIARLFAEPAGEAYHPLPGDPPGTGEHPHDHVYSFATSEPDDFCTIKVDTHPGFDDSLLLQWVAWTLEDAVGWKRIDTGTVQFRGNRCDGSFQGYEIWYRTLDNPGCDGVGCQFVGPVVWNPVNLHYEYEYADLQFEASFLATAGDLDRASLINHETGHALGLADGGPDAPGDPGDPPCPNPPSVMHTYGCGVFPPWPSAEDIAAVEALVPAGSGGGGSFSPEPKGFL